MTTAAKKADHVGMAGNVLLCDHCGSRYDLRPALPMPVGMFAAIAKDWTKTHKRCTGNRKAFIDATTVSGWISSDDTGSSSIAIWRHFMGHHSDGRYPLDPSDFGRCSRLLKLAPDWRSRITEMAKYGDVWSKLAAAWDELTTLYEEELKNTDGMAPKLYARMKEIGA